MINISEEWTPIRSKFVYRGITRGEVRIIDSVYDFPITKIGRDLLPPLDDLSLPEYED